MRNIPPIPITAAEERALIEWAQANERSVTAQIRWALRGILRGSSDRSPPPESGAVETAA
jgi:hypothetical protein